MNVKISGTGSGVPERIVPNSEISKNPSWVSSVLGVDERRRIEKGQSSSDLAYQAAISALEDANCKAEEIDLIILATISPDKLTPSTACILQDRIGATNAVAFDISAACTGFLYGFLTASQFITSKYYSKALVIGVDSLSQYTDYASRDAVYFGDGAGAVVIEFSEEKKILASKMKSEGSHKELYQIDHGSTFKMDGAGVTNYACATLPGLIEDVLVEAEMDKSEIDLVICHQPSLHALKSVAELADIPFEKVRSNLKGFSNTAGASVPLLLDQVVRTESIEAGSKVLFLAIGAGMTSAAAIYEW